MAYSTKYRIPFKELHVDILWEVYIKERDYTGSSTDLIGTAAPLITEYRPENDNDYDWIRPSICTIGMNSLTDHQFIEFFTSDQKKYKIEVYRDSVFLWCGWIVPDAYKEPYMSPSYEVFITATDGLLSLKDIEWKSGGAMETYLSPYTGKRCLMRTIESCLNKLDLNDVDIWDASYIYEANMAQTDSDSPLVQTYHNAERFYDDKNVPLDCYSVLLECLKAQNVQLWMENGYWNLVPQNAKKYSYVRRKYIWVNYGGYYGLGLTPMATETYDPQVTIDNETYRLYASPELTFRPAWKEFRLKQDFGYDNNLLRHKQFTKHGDWTAAIENTDKFVFLEYSEAFENGNYLEWDLGYILQNIGENEFLNIEVKFYGPEDLAIEVMVLLDRSTDYTLSSAADHYTATWNTGTHYIYTMFFSDNFLPKTSNNIPEDGQLKLRIFQPHKLTGSTVVEGKTGFYVSDIKVYLSRNDPMLTEETVTTEINSNNVYIPETLEMMLGDLPYPYSRTVFVCPPVAVGDSSYILTPRTDTFTFVNQGLVYDGGLYWKTGNTYTSTTLWSVKGRNQYNKLRNVIADEIAVNHLDPQWIINAETYGYFGYGATIIEGTKKYSILRGSLNAYDKEWDLELFEISDTEQGYLKLRTGGYIKLRTGDKIKVR